MSAIRVPGTFDLVGRRITRLPVEVAVQLTAAADALDACGIDIILICRACHRETGRYSQSIVRDTHAGQTAILECACTRREAVLGPSHRSET